MNKEEFIQSVRLDLTKYYRKAKYSKTRLFKMYWLGRCWVC